MGLCLSKPAGDKYGAPGAKDLLVIADRKNTSTPSPTATAKCAVADKAEPEHESISLVGSLMPCAPPPTDLIGNLIDPVTGSQPRYIADS